MWQILNRLLATRRGVAALVFRCRNDSGNHVARINPVTNVTCALCPAVMPGEHTLNGLRNRNLAAYLYPAPPPTPAEAKRRCTRVSRIIAQLRGDGLVAKLPRPRRYRPTAFGYRVMDAALRARHDFPAGFATAA